MAGLFPRFGGRRPTGALAEYTAVASPGPKTPLDRLPLLAVDVETTGLDPKKDRLLSIGWVPLNGRTIDLAGAREVILRDDELAEGQGVGDSATLHGITDDTLAAGVPAREALEEFLTALQGRAMLAHYAVMESGFLGTLCRREFGAGLKVPVVDTFELERRHMERMGTYPRGEDLRLARVRQRYGLPYYGNHRAVTDALAAAELYLALTAGGEGAQTYTTLASTQV